MAHFAQLDKDNNVIQCLVVNNSDCNDLPFPESEPIGVAFLQSIFGPDTRWKQTSYNANFRGKYAGIGMEYNEEDDIFQYPQPYPSWISDGNGGWNPPIPCPPDGSSYRWDEDTQRWVIVEMLG